MTHYLLCRCPGYINNLDLDILYTRIAEDSVRMAFNCGLYFNVTVDMLKQCFSKI
jgi:hypothetical protein